MTPAGPAKTNPHEPRNPTAHHTTIFAGTRLNIVTALFGLAAGTTNSPACLLVGKRLGTAVPRCLQLDLRRLEPLDRSEDDHLVALLERVGLHIHDDDLTGAELLVQQPL